MARVEVLVEGFAREEHSRCYGSDVLMTSGAPRSQPAAGDLCACDIEGRCGWRSCGRNTNWAKDRHLCFLTLLLPSVGTILLCKLTAVALDGRKPYSGDIGRCLTQRPSPLQYQKWEEQTFSEQVVNVEVDCGPFYLFEVEGTIPTMHLLFLFERSEFLIDTSQKKSLRVCTRAVCTRAMCSTSLGLSVSYYVPHTYVSQLGSQDTYM